jgi:hypothetical protein
MRRTSSLRVLSVEVLNKISALLVRSARRCVLSVRPRGRRHPRLSPARRSRCQPMSRHTELDPQLVPPSTAAVAVAVMEPLSVKCSLAFYARPSVCLTGCVLVAGLGVL